MRLPTCNQGWPTAKYPCRHNHHWMARWYQGCSKSITKDVPKALWPYHGQCDSLTVEDGLILHREAIIVPPWREEEGLGTNPSRTLRHIQVPVQGKTMHILAWHQQGHQTTGRSMCHMSETSTSGAKAATEANTTTWVTLATTRSWLHDVWWKWILTHCWLLLRDAYSMEDAYFTM